MIYIENNKNQLIIYYMIIINSIFLYKKYKIISIKNLKINQNIKNNLMKFVIINKNNKKLKIIIQIVNFVSIL